MTGVFPHSPEDRLRRNGDSRAVLGADGVTAGVLLFFPLYAASKLELSCLMAMLVAPLTELPSSLRRALWYISRRMVATASNPWTGRLCFFLEGTDCNEEVDDAGGAVDCLRFLAVDTARG